MSCVQPTRMAIVDQLADVIRAAATDPACPLCQDGSTGGCPRCAASAVVDALGTTDLIGEPPRPATVAIDPHYSRALDEIYRQRWVLAYEAGKVAAVLAYASLPVGARRRLAAMFQRLTATARGGDVHADVTSEQRKAVLRAVGAAECLTRGQWEGA